MGQAQLAWGGRTALECGGHVLTHLIGGATCACALIARLAHPSVVATLQRLLIALAELKDPPPPRPDRLIPGSL
jgi:hypothetical protein